MLKKHSLLVALSLTLSLSSCGVGPSTLATLPTPPASQQTPATINDIRMWHAPARSRIVFDMDRHAKLKVFKLVQPHRIVIDLSHVRITGKIPATATTGQFIHRIRRGSPQANITRLVFDLSKPVRYSIRRLNPVGTYQYRLVVDFYHQNALLPTDKVLSSSPRSPTKLKSKLVVLIDPGHGGEDPGASGKRINEKKVVLQIAKKLKAQIDKKSGLQAVLTRTADYYVPLQKRKRIARQRQADLFISLHADAFRDHRARGASVYTLSQSSASSEAASWLANKENAADLVGGVSLADEDEALAEVLLDLSMSNTINESISFGQDVLSELRKIGRVHSKQVGRAGFVVLKSPDIPSILVETAYITNPAEEKQLMNNAHQKRIVKAIVVAIERYYVKNRSRYATR